MTASGTLLGYKVIELAGIGPNPMCAMLLADMGAEVIRVDRLVDSGLGIRMDPKHALLDRSRRSIAVDLKSPGGVELVLDPCVIVRESLSARASFSNDIRKSEIV